MVFEIILESMGCLISSLLRELTEIAGAQLQGLPSCRCLAEAKHCNTLDLSKGGPGPVNMNPKSYNMWVVVKTRVPFWLLIIIRHLLFRVPKKGP